MNIFCKEDLEGNDLPGRRIWKGVGKDGYSKSNKITFGFARYSAEVGAMEPHNHAEEICYVISSDRGWVRYGPEPDKLDKKVELKAGMTMHIPPLEWHVFEYEPGGHVEITFIYGQVDNIRPEEVIAGGA